MGKLKHWLICVVAGVAAVVIYVVSIVLRGRGQDPIAKERQVDDEHRRVTQDLTTKGEALRTKADQLKTQPLPGAMTEAKADEALKDKGWLK